MYTRQTLIVLCAVPAVAHAGANNPDSADYYLKKALSFAEAKKGLDAENHFKKAIGFNPANETLQLTFANYLLQQRKYFLAFDYYKNVVDLNGSNNHALEKLIEICFYLHRWKDLIEYKSNLKSPATSKNNLMLGRAFYEEEDYGMAQKALQHAVEIEPKNFEAWLLLGNVLIEISDYKQAIIKFNQALLVDPNNQDIIYQLGLLYSTVNNEAEAIRYMELAAQKGYKIDLAYKENLGLAYLATDLKKGEEMLRKVLEKKPNDQEILTQIAEANYRHKNYKAAADLFYQMYKKDESNNKALYMTGKAYQRLGDKAYGTSLCDLAIKQDPSLASLKLLKYAN